MNTKGFFALMLPFLGMSAANANGFGSTIVQLHGSGTSNPFRCYGHVLGDMEGQTKMPTRMTYRATATGDGKKDFIGNITFPNNDFASGDIPLDKDEYEALKNNGVEMIHLPTLLGAIGIFHSVPVKTGHSLNMTSCVLARVFRRDIKDWKHSDIEAMNPNLDIPIRTDNYGNVAADQSFPITVARRFLGSSSTFAFTKYLSKSCPDEWPEELVGDIIEWPEDTRICQGSSLMVGCIRDTQGTIGYIDSGLGIDEALDEVALRMNSVDFRAGDFYLTSENAISKGGILPVLDEESANIPDAADVDWSGVDLIDQVQGYVYTWPIVVMTYIYVRKDLSSFIPDPRAQTLLIAFLKNMYDDSYVEVCETRFGFTRIKGRIQELALSGIDMLTTSPDAPEWQVESGSVLPEGGQGDYVISTRRQRSSSVEQEILINSVTSNEMQLLDVKAKIDRINGILGVEGSSNLLNGTLLLGNHEDEALSEFGEEEEQRLNVAFILSVVSLSLWFVTAVFMCILKAELSKLSKSPPAGATVGVETNARTTTRNKKNKKSAMKQADQDDAADEYS